MKKKIQSLIVAPNEFMDMGPDWEGWPCIARQGWGHVLCKFHFLTDMETIQAVQDAVEKFKIASLDNYIVSQSTDYFRGRVEVVLELVVKNGKSPRGT